MSSSPVSASYWCEDGLSEECKALMSSLPSKRAWLGNPLYQYQGHWYFAHSLQGLLSTRKHFEAQETDIFLATFPKSGTTWMKALIFAVTNRAKFTKSFHDHPLSHTSPHLLVPFLDVLFFDKKLAPSRETPSPRLFAMHFPVTLLPDSIVRCGCKIVYICRNPKDVFTSYWHFTNMIRRNEQDETRIDEFFNQFCQGVVPYGPFWDLALGYWKEQSRNPEKVLFLTYEDMKAEPVKQVKKLARFLGCPFSGDEEACGVIDAILRLCSLENLRSANKDKIEDIVFGIESNHFYRKGEVGDSRNYLTDEMMKQLDTITSEKFHSFGLRFPT